MIYHVIGKQWMSFKSVQHEIHAKEPHLRPPFTYFCLCQLMQKIMNYTLYSTKEPKPRDTIKSSCHLMLISLSE